MPTAHAPRTEAGAAAQRARRNGRIRVAAGIAGVGVVGAAAWWVVQQPPRVETPPPERAEAIATATVEATASVVPTVPPPPSEPVTITVAAVGDMQFDRQVKALISKSGGAAPLAEVAERLASADITMGNLESPLSTRGVRRTDKPYTFQGDPRGVEGLAAAGFDFLALANNHTLDCGNDAFADTLGTLDANGIGHAGAGMNKAEAWTPAVRQIGETTTTVAFLSFSHVLPVGFIATSKAPGIAQGRLNMKEVEEAIRAADAAYDYVIVSYHWGVENVDDCNAEQVTDAHRSIDAGADLVLSHHPHVIQAVERYNGGLIAYSLGDFVFDHYSRKTGEAFILEAELGPGGVGAVRIVPVYLDSYGRPKYVPGEEGRVILERLATISAKRNTYVQIDGDTGVVR